jgi:hypothetical protein
MSCTHHQLHHARTPRAGAKTPPLASTPSAQAVRAPTSPTAATPKHIDPRQPKPLGRARTPMTPTTISVGARRAASMLIVALLALGALTGNASAQTHVDGISQGVLSSPAPDGNLPRNQFTNNEPTGYVRHFATWSDWGSYNGSSCVQGPGNSTFISDIQAIRAFATPVVVMNAPGYAQDYQGYAAQDELCAVDYMMQALKAAGQLPHPLILEPANEPEGYQSAPIAADFVADSVLGAYYATGSTTSVYILAGSFVHPDPNSAGEYDANCPYNTTSFETCYYDELQAQGYLQYVSGWSVHDYDDPIDSQNLNWCYVTNGSFSGCDDPALSAWRGWENGIADNNTWITETGDPDQFLRDNCNEPHPNGCTATGKNAYTNARSATAVEYLSQWTAHTFWYDWEAGYNTLTSEWCSTPGWDSSLLNTYAAQHANSQDSPRAAYYVLGLHYNTSNAITTAGTNGDYEEAYFTGESCPN